MPRWEAPWNSGVGAEPCTWTAKPCSFAIRVRLYCQAMYRYIVLHILLFGHLNAMYTTRLSSHTFCASLSCTHTSLSRLCTHKRLLWLSLMRSSVQHVCDSPRSPMPLIMHAAAFPKVGKNPSQYRRRRSWLSLPGPRQDEMHRENSESPSLSPSVA